MTNEPSGPDLARALDAAVVVLACTGDSRAFGEIVRRRQQPVRRFMGYLCGNRAEGDDLAQQVFLTAWRSIRRLRSPAAFDGWLKKIMVTTWLEAVRRKRVTYADEADPDGAGPSYLQSSGLRIDLGTALAQLPAGMRLCVVLAYDEGMTHDEIASLTGLPLGTVKSNISRGSARLRAMLSDYRKGRGA